jgi:hypothetical protein
MMNIRHKLEFAAEKIEHDYQIYGGIKIFRNMFDPGLYLEQIKENLFFLCSKKK